jgi:hypothetical protein
MPMLMPRVGSWNFMFMGQAYIVETQQSGPRGGDKLWSPNAFMSAAEHRVGTGSLMFQSMLSLEPATVTNERYPLLFQTGETAYGKPLVDAQHPHDFIMSLGIQYAHPLSENSMLQLYYVPGGRSRAGTGSLSASRFGGGAAHGDARSSLAGLDAHRRQRCHDRPKIQMAAVGGQRFLWQ